MIPADKLYLAPLTTALESDELATSARFQLPPEGAGWGFAEVARRHGDFALVGCAGVLVLDGAGRVAAVIEMGLPATGWRLVRLLAE